MAANQVDFKILPSDQFSVYSPQTRSDKVITYFTLLSKLRGDILSVGQDDDPNDIVSAFYSSVGGTQTLHLVKADGSEVTASVPEPTVGTVTSVDLTASTGISVSGGPITTSGSITVTNTAPDQVVVLTGAGTTSISGTYPSFTITSNDQFVGTVTSVGLTMPAAFSVANSPVTTSGTLAVTAAGLSSQYIRGDGQLANFPSSGGGGSSVNYYLNGSVSQGTFGGDTYYELSKTPIAGAGTNFTRAHGSGDGYVASFITDANDPDQINIPGGNFNLEFYFNSSSSGGSPAFYGELYKVSTLNVFTLIASGSANPESITGGTTVDQYYTSIAVPQTALLSTDRLAIRVYVIVDGRNITLHTENSNFSEVITTFSTGLNSLNGLSDQVQYFAVGTSGTDFAISSSVDTHTFNLPTASAANRGALSSTDWTTFNSKEPALTKGNLTEATSAVLTITGGTGAVIGTGTSIQVAQSGVSTSGFLSSTDWNTFNGKQNAITLTTTGTTGAATLIGATLNIPSYADQFVGTVTSVNMSVPTGFAISGNPIVTSGTLAVAFDTGYSLPTNASQTTWNTAYNDSITAFAYNTSTAVLTLTQQDAGTLTATVTLQPFSTSNLAEGTNLYYTDARARLALSAGTGISYSTTTGVITNSAPDLTVVLTASTGISVTGTYPSFTVANTAPDQTVVLTGGTGITTSGTYPSFTVTNSDRGSSQNIFKNIAVAGQSTIVADTNDDTLTVVAGSGVTITTNDTTDTITISATGSGGSVTSVGTTAPITGGTITTTGTIGITQSGAAADGYLSSTDWGTFNSKQPQLNGTGFVKASGTTISYDNNTYYLASNPSGFTSNTGTVTSVGLTGGTGISISGGPITTSGSITVTNSAPDQTVALTAGTGISISGTYPSFTITNTSAGGGTITGSGTTNYVSKFTSASAIGDSVIYDDGTKVGIGTTVPATTLHVNGEISLPSTIRLTNAGANNAYISESWGINLNGFTTHPVQVRGASFSVGYSLGGGTSYATDSMFVAGNVGIGTTSPSQKLDVSGNIMVLGLKNTNDYFEKILGDVSFANGDANKAFNIILGNSSVWGYIEVEVNSTYNNQSSAGKLTKRFAIGTNTNNNIYINESRVSDAMGSIVDNIAIGNFAWDGAISSYVIPISHIVSTGNAYNVRVRCYSMGGGASTVFTALSLSAVYTLTALARQYPYYNDRLGIGTTSPAKILTIAASSQTWAGAPQVAFYDTVSGQVDARNWTIGAISTNYGNFTIANSTAAGGDPTNARLTINKDGNVGINTTAPSAKLDVSTPGATASNNALQLRAGNNSNTFGSNQILFSYNETAEYRHAIKSRHNSGSAVGNDIDFFIWKYGTDATGTIGTQHVMTLEGNGNVGIGTTAPGAKLHLSGAGATELRIASTTGNTNSLLSFYEVALASWGIDAGQANGSFFIKDLYNSATRLTILNSGNVGINTTNPSSGKLEVHSTGDVPYILMNTTATANKRVRLQFTQGGNSGMEIGTDYSVNNGNNFYFYDRVNAATLGFISATTTWFNSAFGINNTNPTYNLDVTGDARILSGSLGVGVAPNATDGRIDASNDIVAFSSSDLRLKENIKPIENALEKVKSLTGVEFDWKPELKHAHGYEGHDTGVIAQEVQDVMPTAIRTNDTGYLAVRYEKLIGLLIEANKELAARVEELESKFK